MFSNFTYILTALLLTILLPLPSQGTPPPPEISSKPTSSVVAKGVKIELSVESEVLDEKVREGEYANLSLRINDATTGAPVAAMSPAVWVDLRKKFDAGKKGLATLSCEDKVRTYLQGALSYRPDVDLSSYFILTLNNDATISVIDPILGVSGYSQLYAMVLLKKTGYDWAFTHDEKKLAVTMPKAGEVAVVSTETFKVVQTVPAGSLPGRIILQPDRRYFWVGNDADDASGGVTALDAARFDKAGFVATGPGSHELAISDDSRFLYVTNPRNATLSVVSSRDMKKISDIPLPSRPVGVAWSSLAKAAYVGTEGGDVLVIDGRKHDVTVKIKLAPGLAAIRFAPGDRWCFGVSAATDTVQVIDASANAIAYSAKTGESPYQVAFSDNFAYVRCRKTALVTLVPLGDLGKADKLNIVTVSGGQRPPGDLGSLASPADITVNAPEVGGMLLGSPEDASIIYYMEGMQVPMGNFNTYGRKPRALSVVSRRLKETAPGVYTAKMRIPKEGTYDTVVFVDAPRMVQCMEFSAEKNPIFAKLAAERAVSFDVGETGSMQAGKEFRLKFRMRDLEGEPISDVRDVVVLPSLAPLGAWQENYLARHIGAGEYEAVFTPPKPGTYQVFFSVPSLKVKLSQIQPITLKAE